MKKTKLSRYKLFRKSKALLECRQALLFQDFQESNSLKEACFLPKLQNALLPLEIVVRNFCDVYQIKTYNLKYCQHRDTQVPFLQCNIKFENSSNLEVLEVFRQELFKKLKDFHGVPFQQAQVYKKIFSIQIFLLVSWVEEKREENKEEIYKSTINSSNSKAQETVLSKEVAFKPKENWFQVKAKKLDFIFDLFK